MLHAIYDWSQHVDGTQQDEKPYQILRLCTQCHVFYTTINGSPLNTDWNIAHQTFLIMLIKITSRTFTCTE